MMVGGSLGLIYLRCHDGAFMPFFSIVHYIHDAFLYSCCRLLQSLIDLGQALEHTFLWVCRYHGAFTGIAAAT